MSLDHPQNETLDLLRAVGRARGGASDSVVDRALDEIGVAVVATPRRGWRRRWRSARLRSPRRALLIGVATVALGGGVAVGAGLFVPAFTGRYVGRTPNWAGGQLLVMQGTRFDQIIPRFAAGIPFPADGAAWKRGVLRNAVSESRPIPCPKGAAGPCRTVMTTGSLRAQFADSAFCAWLSAWRRAAMTGDRVMMERAARQIAAAPDWPAVTNADPHVAHGGTEGFFGWFLPFVVAVKRDAPADVDSLFVANSASSCAIFSPGFMRHITRLGYPRISELADGASYDHYIRAGSQ